MLNKNHKKGRRAPAKGFTLIEMMITVVIVSILAAIAYPSYQNQIRKSRRAEAKTLLLEAANRQERFYTTSTPNAYAGSMTALGYGADAQPSGDSGAANAWYNVRVMTAAQAAVVTGAACPVTNCFVLEATPLRGQAEDTICARLQLDSRGRKYETGTGDVNDCW